MKKFLKKMAIGTVTAALAISFTASSVVAGYSPTGRVDWNSIPYEGPVQLTPQERAARRQLEQQLIANCTQQVIRVGDTVFVIDENTRPEVLQMLDAALSNDVNSATVADFSATYTSNNDVVVRIFTSAIDGTPFKASFSPQTGIADFFGDDGEIRYSRDLGSIEAFNELAVLNAQVARMSIAQRMDKVSADRINRDFSMLNRETRVLSEFDAYGNKTETILNDAEVADILAERSSPSQISPLFDTDEFYVPFVPFADTPINGFNVAGWQWTNGRDRWIDLWTFGFPSGMRVMDVFFTNRIGDDTAIRWSIPPMNTAWHILRFPGEQYAARVSTPQRGDFRSVRVRFFSS